MKTKWIFITIVLMILAYATITAAITFAWMLYIGSIAAGVVLIVIAYFKIKKWWKRNQL